MITLKQYEQLTGKKLPPAKAQGVPKPEMNQTEQAYNRVLMMRRGLLEIADYWFEGITLKLGVDVRYTPDFLVQLNDGMLECHEVKAGIFLPGAIKPKPLIRDDALAKLRIAATVFPFRFRLVYRHKDYDFGDWQIEDV